MNKYYLVVSRDSAGYPKEVREVTEANAKLLKAARYPVVQEQDLHPPPEPKDDNEFFGWV